MKLNNKGFSLVEVLAVIAILATITLIMVPNVTKIIKSNEENSLNNLKDSITSAAKIYISDNRYNIELENNCKNIETANIININGNEITNSKIPLNLLTNAGDLDENIVNPSNRTQKYNLEKSYIKVTFNCQTKKYQYGGIELKLKDN